MLGIHIKSFKHLAGLSYAGLAGSSAAFLLLLAALLFAPAASQPEAAAEESANANPNISTYASDPTASINLPSTIDFADVLPTAAGVTTTASASLTITTSSSGGYSLYFYSSNGNNSLTPINPNNSSSISSTPTTTELNNLNNNTWGYNLSTEASTGDTTTYSTIPTSSTTPVQTKDTSTTNSANDTYTLSLGAKVDNTIPSGVYSNDLVVAVVAEPGGIPITYDANGGYYNDDSSQTTQLVEYTIGQRTVTKIAKTSNISDDGAQSGGYGDNVEEIQTVTIPGAESLQVTVSYQTESTRYDWLAIYDGSVTPSRSNYADSVTGKLGGSTKVDNAVFTIPGDTAQFYFRSDSSSSNYYGYYAVVEGTTGITPSAEVLTPTRPGYDFLGWYKDSAGTPGEEFTVDTSLQAGTVYAKWGLSIQDFTNAQCQSLASTSSYTVYDERDGNDYTVRYINGACWMTQNLRLTGGQTLTSEESNIVGSWEFPDDSLTLGDSSTEARSTISDDPEHALEYGGYYNYCAASAGTVCNNTTAQDAVQDICPKGWRLPTHDEQSGIAGTGYVSAFSPALSGSYTSGSLINGGRLGYWWSATASYSDSQYILDSDGNGLGAFGYGRTGGNSVRCIRSNPGTLTINFNGNGSDGGSTASQQIAAGNTASLNINGFIRTNYVFTGWNTAADGSGTSYADGADYTVTPATGDAEITLYARWKEIVNLGYIQDVTEIDCIANAASRPAIATDRRDNNVYTLRYINGACWMTQNLRLSGGRTLTPANSNVTRNWSFPNNSLDENDTNYVGGYSYTEAGFAISDDPEHALEYGGYYNYCAASAGTVCNNTTAQDATQDICPKGWRLPTPSEQTDLIGSVSAFSPVYSGRYHNGSLNFAGSDGYWWSATAFDKDWQLNLNYSDGSLVDFIGASKSSGNSVRCILSESVHRDLE